MRGHWLPLLAPPCAGAHARIALKQAGGRAPDLERQTRLAAARAGRARCAARPRAPACPGTAAARRRRPGRARSAAAARCTPRPLPAHRAMGRHISAPAGTAARSRQVKVQRPYIAAESAIGQQ